MARVTLEVFRAPLIDLLKKLSKLIHQKLRKKYFVTTEGILHKVMKTKELPLLYTKCK